MWLQILNYETWWWNKEDSKVRPKGTVSPFRPQVLKPSSKTSEKGVQKWWQNKIESDEDSDFEKEIYWFTNNNTWFENFDVESTLSKP